MLIDVAVAKAPKYPFPVSGDTLEMIERPHGGLSFVLADGQGHGPAAKYLSHLVATKAVSLLADGVRDGAAARATHDFLYAYRQGKVSADLTILSLDLASKTLVVSCNSACPLLVISNGEARLAPQKCEPIGIYARTKPAISEMPLVEGLAVIAISDGIMEAGRRYGHQLNLLATVQTLMTTPLNAQGIADGLLAEAVRFDQGRPEDDSSVLVLAASAGCSEHGTRRLHVSFPIETH